MKVSGQSDRVVIIGSGMAGYFLVQAIREQSKDVPVVLLTENDGRFYPKPMLSSALYHRKSPADIVTATADDMAKKYQVDIRTFACVEMIDSAAKKIFYRQGDNKEVLEYAHVVLATGSDPKTLPLAGSGVSECYQINTLEAYESWTSNLNTGDNIAIIGSGLVGVEFAHDLTHAGYNVQVVSQFEQALYGLVPDNIGLKVRHHLQSLGVDWMVDRCLQRIEKVKDGLLLCGSDGREILVDKVLMAVGIAPRTDLKAEGLIIDDRGGYKVDVYAKTANASIYAIGDCACVCGLQMTYVAPIKQQVKALAQTLTGVLTPIVYPAMPVVVKTPTMPLTMVPVRGDYQGRWHDVSEQDDQAVSAFYDDDQHLRGFVLQGTATVKRSEWLEKMPMLMG
ncbi:MAG: FAD-dependent oxidoreductase [Pseudomonadota bacterium]|nr:FAD-dependent oxidoreductase [Pseudomonadota bacterium]